MLTITVGDGFSGEPADYPTCNILVEPGTDLLHALTEAFQLPAGWAAVKLLPECSYIEHYQPAAVPGRRGLYLHLGFVKLRSYEQRFKLRSYEQRESGPPTVILTEDMPAKDQLQQLLRALLGLNAAAHHMEWLYPPAAPGAKEASASRAYPIATLLASLLRLMEDGVAVTSQGIFRRDAVKRRFSIMVDYDDLYEAARILGEDYKESPQACLQDILERLPADNETTFPGCNDPALGLTTKLAK